MTEVWVTSECKMLIVCAVEVHISYYHSDSFTLHHNLILLPGPMSARPPSAFTKTPPAVPVMSDGLPIL